VCLDESILKGAAKESMRYGWRVLEMVGVLVEAGFSVIQTAPAVAWLADVVPEIVSAAEADVQVGSLSICAPPTGDHYTALSDTHVATGDRKQCGQCSYT
jgi:hypothetical protein